MWDLPRPGLEPVSPALAGGFLTTEPPGKSRSYYYHPLFLKDEIMKPPGEGAESGRATLWFQIANCVFKVLF